MSPTTAYRELWKIDLGSYIHIFSLSPEKRISLIFLIKQFSLWRRGGPYVFKLWDINKYLPVGNIRQMSHDWQLLEYLHWLRTHQPLKCKHISPGNESFTILTSHPLSFMSFLSGYKWKFFQSLNVVI